MHVRAPVFVKAAVACAILLSFAAFVGCNLTTGPGGPTTQSSTGASNAPAAPSASGSPVILRSPIMMDAVFVLATIGFFAVSVLYVYGCGRL
jgi:hypothetical protein